MSQRLVVRGARASKHRVQTTNGIIDGRDIDATNTGYRGSLTTVTTNGGDWYTSDGSPNGKLITGTLFIDSPIASVMQDFWAYKGIKQNFNSSGRTFEHFSLGMPNGAWSGDYAAIYGGYTMRFGNIFGFSDGPHVNGDSATPTLLEDCFIHNLVQGNVNDHNDGIQMENGSNTTIRRCRIQRNDGNNQTSCIIIGADLGNIDNVLIEGCFLESNNPNFQVAIYWGHDVANGYSATNCTIRNNWFSDNTFVNTVISANDTYTASGNKRLSGTVIT